MAARPKFGGFSDRARAGDIHLYRFQATGRWTVTLQTETPEFVGYRIGFDARAGNLAPHGYGGDGTAATAVALDGDDFQPDGGEHVFGVTDWFGRGTNVASTPFTYRVVVAPE